MDLAVSVGGQYALHCHGLARLESLKTPSSKGRLPVAKLFFSFICVEKV